MKCLTDDVDGGMISGRRAADGSGWCWYCNTRHERVTTKRTPCCGDCWFDEAPPTTMASVSSELRAGAVKLGNLLLDSFRPMLERIAQYLGPRTP